MAVVATKAGTFQRQALTTMRSHDAGSARSPARRCLRASPVVVVLLLAACGTTPKRTTEPGATRTPPGVGAPSASTPTKRGGGYYLDDGPGDSPPPDLALLPDAVPRIEKYASGANRPYNVFGVDYVPDLSGAPYRQRGVGSWYGRKFHGQRTSNGEIYDMYAMTAAHPTLPLPSYALVTNLQNGRSVIVRVNDRGPFLHNRVMDLSYAAAYKLGYMSSGSGMIEVEMLMPADIAAGRIPATTTGLLAAASNGAPMVAAAVPSAPSTAPSTAPSPTQSATTAIPAQSGLTIEALTASVPAGTVSGSQPVDARPTLPPAPAIVPEAISRSLPLTPPLADVDRAPQLIALPDRQPAAALPEVATSAGFYLQLGAFKARAGADSFAAHVSRELDPAIASRVHVSDANGLYRVRVGPYRQRADADGVATTLRAAISQPVLVTPEGLRPR